jgi:peptidoglycan/LPS O-acetylase OafA/YrhL
MVNEFLSRHFESPASGARSLPMEGLRGFAALLVFLVHFDSLFYPYFADGSLQRRSLDIGGSLGHTGVDLFFVISGFLVYGIIMKKKPSYFTFVWQRIRRLYPVFLAVLAVYLILSLLFPAQSKLPDSAGKAALYIAANVAMLGGMTSIQPIITVSWSLSYEWCFYLVIPLMISVFLLRRWTSRQRVLLFLALAIVHFSLCAIGVLSHVRLAMFGAGIILWELVVVQRLPAKLKGWGEYIAIIVFLVNILIIGFVGAANGKTALVLLSTPRFYAPTLFVSIFFLTVYALFFDGVLKSLFSWNYLRWIGNISYSYYLIHGLVLHGLKLTYNFLFPSGPRSLMFDLMLLLVCVVVSIFVASLLYLLVEKPLSWPKKNPQVTTNEALRDSATLSATEAS